MPQHIGAGFGQCAARQPFLFDRRRIAHAGHVITADCHFRTLAVAADKPQSITLVEFIHRRSAGAAQLQRKPGLILQPAVAIFRP